MKRLLFMLLFGALASAATAGTMIYKTADGEEKIISKVKLLSLDNDGKVVVFSLGSGTQRMSIERLVKYYDTDIQVTEGFDDNTAKYDISFSGDPNFPARIKSGDKTKPVFSITYTFRRQRGEKFDKPLKTPYFYLFVMVANDEDNSRSLHFYSYPNKARISLKSYNEAKMLEKVVALDRPNLYERDGNSLGNTGKTGAFGDRKTEFQLTGIKSGKIIGYYLVAWNKTRISAVKEWNDISYKIGDYWWYNQGSN